MPNLSLWCLHYHCFNIWDFRRAVVLQYMVSYLGWVLRHQLWSSGHSSLRHSRHYIHSVDKSTKHEHFKISKKFLLCITSWFLIIKKISGIFNESGFVQIPPIKDFLTRYVVDNGNNHLSFRIGFKCRTHITCHDYKAYF